MIELNVGGTLYTTFKSTLRKHELSLLDSMFSGRYPAVKDSQGRFVIDRDGQAFRYILNFLRTDVLHWPDSEYDKKLLATELKYFGLEDAVPGGRVVDSTVLSGDEAALLQGWLDERKAVPTGTWRVVYRGSRDGFGAADFHRLCDAHPQTLCVVTTTTGRRFGGYQPSCSYTEH